MLTEKRRACNVRWDEKNLTRMSLAVPKDLRKQMEDYIATSGETMNGFLKRAIVEAIKTPYKK